MKRILAGVALVGAALSAPALAQYGVARDNVDAAYLVQVRAGPNRHFYRMDLKGCPAITAKCRLPSYVVPGDVLVAYARAGRFTWVQFVNRRGVTSESYVETAALAPVRVATPPPSSWAGTWKATEAEIAIKPLSPPGRFAVKGYASWGTRDPVRVKNGGIHVGEMEGVVSVAGGVVTSASGDVMLERTPGGDYGGPCKVYLRRLGPYLLAQDNLSCGGLNVTFNGAYRKM